MSKNTTAEQEPPQEIQEPPQEPHPDIDIDDIGALYIFPIMT